METTNKNLRDIKSQTRITIPDMEHGFFNSSTIALGPQDVFAFCQNESNVERVLRDLPKGIKNFLDLTLVSADHTGTDQYEVKWKNKPEAKVQGTLNFTLAPAQANRGTLLTAVAIFDQMNSNSEEPSDLMNVFLKRMKALVETGEIATTKGQPSGREEIEESQDQILH